MAEKLEKDDWKSLVIPSLSGGMRLDERSDSIKDVETILSLNVWNDNNTIKVDSGYKKFLGTVRGAPRGTYQFFTTTGISYLCLITNSTFYVEQNNEWQYVSDGTSTTLSVAASGGNTVLTTVGSATFVAGNFIGIALNSGLQHRTTVVSHVGTALTITDAMPGTGVVANIGKIVLRAPALAGDADTQVSTVGVPSHNWFVFTNGINNVKRFDGSTVQDIPNLPSGGNTQCTLVALFETYLLLLGTTEGGVHFPQRVRRCDESNPTEWTLGNAGFSDLLGSEDWIVAVSDLGPYMIIYKERSIIRMEFLGSADALFNFDYMISGEGALSQDGVVNLGDYHIFVGNTNIYKYRGSFDLESVGDAIYPLIFGVGGSLNPSYKKRVFVIYIEELDEAWIFYPSGSDSNPADVARYNLSTDSWSLRVFTRAFIGFGFFIVLNDSTWQEASGSWLDHTDAWNSVRYLSNSPTTHFCGATDSQVYEYNYLVFNDDGTAIPYQIETKDFSDPGYDLRIDWLEAQITGGNTLLEYSIDEGSTWVTYGTFIASAQFKPFRLYGDNGQFVANKVRWRFSGTGSGFKLGWVRMNYRREAEWQ